jgi:hypothetical protein
MMRWLTHVRILERGLSVSLFSVKFSTTRFGNVADRIVAAAQAIDQTLCSALEI